MPLADEGGERLPSAGFAVREDHLRLRRREEPDPFQQLALTGVSAESFITSFKPRFTD